jgi:hypothetical protein
LASLIADPWSANFFAAFAYSGARFLQWPHQGASVTYISNYYNKQAISKIHSPEETQNICHNHYINVTLALGWITLFMGDMGEGALHREDEVTVKQRN